MPASGSGLPSYSTQPGHVRGEAREGSDVPRGRPSKAASRCRGVSRISAPCAEQLSTTPSHRLSRAREAWPLDSGDALASPSLTTMSC